MNHFVLFGVVSLIVGCSSVPHVTIFGDAGGFGQGRDGGVSDGSSGDGQSSDALVAGDQATGDGGDLGVVDPRVARVLDSLPELPLDPLGTLVEGATVSADLSCFGTAETSAARGTFTSGLSLDIGGPIGVTVPMRFYRRNSLRDDPDLECLSGLCIGATIQASGDSTYVLLNREDIWMSFYIPQINPEGWQLSDGYVPYVEYFAPILAFEEPYGVYRFAGAVTYGELDANYMRKFAASYERRGTFAKTVSGELTDCANRPIQNAAVRIFSGDDLLLDDSSFTDLYDRWAMAEEREVTPSTGWYALADRTYLGGSQAFRVEAWGRPTAESEPTMIACERIVVPNGGYAYLPLHIARAGRDSNCTL